jgi:hypothetical protein
MPIVRPACVAASQPSDFQVACAWTGSSGGNGGWIVLSKRTGRGGSWALYPLRDPARLASDHMLFVLSPEDMVANCPDPAHRFTPG